MNPVQETRSPEAQMERMASGSWRLPSIPSMDQNVTLLPNKTLEWTVTPTSPLRTAAAIVTGEKMTGTWAIRLSRPTAVGDQVRNVTRTSSMLLRGSSLALGLPPISLPNATPPALRYEPPKCFLILKITNFPQSLLNLTIFGTQTDLVDWVHNLKEIFADHAHAVTALSIEKLTLRLPNGQQSTWERVSRFFPDATTIPEFGTASED
jgi:hypothetical protein